MNFNYLGLKKLICTSYAGSPIAHTELNDLPLFKQKKKLPYMIEITEVADYNNDGAEDLADIELLLRNDNNTLTILDGDGDFRSEESIGFLQEADIVVTNPPFSLFREFIALLTKYNKQFLVLGNMNSITHKEIFPLIKNNKVWLGYKPMGKDALFHVSDALADYLLKNKKEGSGYRIIDGEVLGRANAIWYTNLDTTKRHDELVLYKKYNPDDYPTYDNFDAINVNKVIDIPEDYDGIMGVPITFLDKYNPEQFDIIGEANHGIDSEYDLFAPRINGKTIFKRLLIKRRKNEN